MLIESSEDSSPRMTTKEPLDQEVAGGSNRKPVQAGKRMDPGQFDCAMVKSPLRQGFLMFEDSQTRNRMSLGRTPCAGPLHTCPPRPPRIFVQKAVRDKGTKRAPMFCMKWLLSAERTRLLQRLQYIHFTPDRGGDDG
jgi:hypothetical protein